MGLRKASSRHSIRAENQKNAPLDRAGRYRLQNGCGYRKLRTGETVGDAAKDVADLRTDHRKNRDHDDRNQDKDQRIFDQTLSLFFLTWQIKHKKPPE